jgi:hypothetical protein
MACPLLNQCKKVGMDCSERKFTQCDFYKQILSEDRAEKEKEKSWSEPQKLEERRENARKMRSERWKTQREIELKAKQLEALEHEQQTT